ncbi:MULTISPECIES: hypothetical protein [Enterobacteriaceae]|uniref:hypothetical protein n=1 Tax=Enterobacteriaceae TaxID=543 RepID=UPI001244987B|nr:MULTISPECIES: hypothetical protein [Enterobacteriaceae]
MIRKKEEKPVTSFLSMGFYPGYTQMATFAGTVIQRHQLPKNLLQTAEKADNEEMVTKKPAPALLNTPNREQEMQYNHIMPLALALRNVEAGQSVHPASPVGVSRANAGSRRCIKDAGNDRKSASSVAGVA